MTSRHKKGWRKIRYVLEENPVCFREKAGMVGRCFFVAFRVDLQLQSPIIIFFTDVQTTEQSRTVEYTRLDFGEKFCMVWRKIQYEIQFGEKSGMFKEKSGVSPEKSCIYTTTCVRADSGNSKLYTDRVSQGALGAEFVRGARCARRS
jgi:hypothetical protein